MEYSKPHLDYKDQAERLKDKIARLVNMIGSDGGFYLLATQSFIESYLREHFPHFDSSSTTSFNTNLQNYREFLKNSASRNISELKSFTAIMSQRSLSNAVRHNFESMGIEEVRAATFNFLQFCKAVGIYESNLKELASNLDMWKNKTCRKDDLKELERVKHELAMVKHKNEELLHQHKYLDDARAQREHLEKRIFFLDSEIEKAHNRTQLKNEKIDALRKERGELKEANRKIASEIDKQKGIEQYLDNLLRMSFYTRSRMDYERSLTSLTPEQKNVLSGINLKSDYLIKGGAGTGKTLVLLEALRKANQGNLAFANKKMLLLTYTKTLVKYNRYISHIMEMQGSDTCIRTADGFLNDAFRAQFPEASIIYDFDELYEENNSSNFFDDALLKCEIEDFIYGYNISEQEYLHDMIPRKGMKNRLTKAQRKEIWDIKTEMEYIMTDSQQLSKGFARKTYIDWLHSNPEHAQGHGHAREPAQGHEREQEHGDGQKQGHERWHGQEYFDHIFVDEAQDLHPVELQILKALSTISVIMSGDTDQSIYGIGSPYKRASVSTQGKTRILKMNFRNTIPIHKLAENFRGLSPDSRDKEIAPVAFREGPVPELYTASNTAGLYEQLLEKVNIFVHKINYDPENIGILAPTTQYLDKLKELLGRAGFSAKNIKDEDFSFEMEGSIRLSTLHSSKGLDIPVVLLFLPRIYYSQFLDKEAGSALARNLMYVSMTRAMENLNIFTLKNSSDPIIRSLLELM